MQLSGWLVPSCALILAGCAAPYYTPAVPPPIEERVPAPPVAKVPLIWEPGHYTWDGGRYHWSPGRWVERAGHGGVRRLAYEAHHVTVETHAGLAALADAPELVPLGHAVETLRTVKDDGELELLREACAIGDRALAETLGQVAPGLTEREAALLCEEALRVTRRVAGVPGLVRRDIRIGSICDQPQQIGRLERSQHQALGDDLADRRMIGRRRLAFSS